MHHFISEAERIWCITIMNFFRFKHESLTLIAINNFFSTIELLMS